MSLLLYAKQITPRLSYISKLILQDRLGLEIEITSDITLFKQTEGPKINYGLSLSQRSLTIPACGLLFEKNIKSQEIILKQQGNLPYFFPLVIPGSALPFDLFAFTFYLLTRYEEYLPFQADQHGRFRVEDSLAYQKQFLHLPLVDQWIQHLGKQLQQKYPQLQIKQPKYRFHPTFDIDAAWAFLQRPWWQLGGGMIKDLLLLRLQSFEKRLKVIQGKQKDPYYTFDYIKALHINSFNPPIFFFLLGDRSTYDRNINHRREDFRKLINELNISYRVGIHPSYLSNQSPNQLKEEKNRLENIINQKITQSRQHFLKLHLPSTYQQLIQIGITDDYSMGYAGDIGFRASTCFPYQWYDLQREEATSLTIHPFQVMDVTLKKYLNLKPEEGIAALQPIIQNIRSVGGSFYSLWHNSSFSVIDRWEDWKEAYEELVRMAEGE